MSKNIETKVLKIENKTDKSRNIKLVPIKKRGRPLKNIPSSQINRYLQKNEQNIKNKCKHKHNSLMADHKLYQLFYPRIDFNEIVVNIIP